MKRHPRARLWLLIIATLIALASVAILCFLGSASPINLAAFERIELGMTRDDVMKAIGARPGNYNVSPKEQFVLGEHRGTIVFLVTDYEEIERETAVYDIVSRKTGKPVARLWKWANEENAIFVITEDDKVIGKTHSFVLSTVATG